MKLLLTAFDPFGGETVNPAHEAILLLPDTISGIRIVKLEVPTVFGKSVATVVEAMEREKPDAILCVGQAGGRFGITPERVAINLSDAPIPDNAGNQPADTPINRDGPAAYFSTLPIKAMVRAIRSEGLPANISNSAGTFVCNHLMYGILHHIHTKSLSTRGGFIHVPYLPDQVAEKQASQPSMSKTDIARGLQAAIRAIFEEEAGAVPASGALC